jgi:hypothetical protein
VTAQQALGTFRKKVRERPFLFFGSALGAGLLAGGAIAPRVLGRILSVGGALTWRMVLLPMIKERVMSVVEGRPTKENEDEAERYR